MPWQPEASEVIRQRNVCPSSRLTQEGLFCELDVEPSHSRSFLRHLGRTAQFRKAGEAMSLPFLGRCTLAGLIAFLPIAAEFSQSASSGPAISANVPHRAERDLVRRTAAQRQRATGREGKDWEPSPKSFRAAKARTNEEKRCGAMQSIFQDASRCSHLYLCESGRRRDQTELPA